MHTKSADNCIADNDFEEAKYRYENTSPRWKEHWWETIVIIYKKCTELAKKYILDFKNKVILTGSVLCGLINNLTENFKKGTNICYLFKFYDNFGQIVFSKIGTTTRTVEKRAQEELRNYSKNFDVIGVTIDSAIDCGEVDPEGAESYCRAMFIKEYPNTFLKNDRFLGVDIPTERFNNLVASYLA